MMTSRHLLQDVQEAVARVRSELPSHTASTVRDLERIETAVLQLDGLLSRDDARLRRSSPEALRVARHRFRTPLNQIIGYCELLQEDLQAAGREEGRVALDDLHAKTRRLARAINEITKPVSFPVGRAEANETLRQHGGTVLIVDDCLANLDMLSRRLEADGHDVLCARDGHEAMARLRERPVDVVLLDVLMPNMDGYDTLDAIKRDPVLESTPVIMLTSVDDPQSVVMCLEKGAEDHLPKPFNAMLLRARIGRCLQKKRLHDLTQRYLERILAEKQRADDLLHGVIPIGVALSQERDRQRLVEKILVEAQRFCGAEGGLLWLVNAEKSLQPILVRCSALPGPNDPLATLGTLSHPHVNARPAPAHAALTRGQAVHIEHVGESPDYDLGALQRFCARFDYTIVSLIAVPLRTPDGENVGVLELWNARHPLRGEIIAFGERTIEVLESLSALAAVAVSNYEREMSLRAKIEQLEVRIDEDRRQRAVSSITETDYFQALQDKARRLRARSREERG